MEENVAEESAKQEEVKEEQTEENREDIKESEKVFDTEKEEKIIEEPKTISEDKMGKIRAFLSGKDKEASWKPIIFVMIASSVVLFAWDKIPALKEGVHSVLDPSVGLLLNWNLNFGMILIVAIISLLTTLAQKYCTDQATLKELKKEQKILQDKSKEFKSHPEKMMKIQKEISPLMMKTMKLSMRSIMFTGIPFILFFRWFNDFFTAMGDPKFFGFLGWIWVYLIGAIIFGSLFRKFLKAV